MAKKVKNVRDINFDEMEIEVLPPVRQVKADQIATKNDKRFSVKFRATPDAIEITFDLWLRGKSRIN